MCCCFALNRFKSAYNFIFHNSLYFALASENLECTRNTHTLSFPEQIGFNDQHPYTKRIQLQLETTSAHVILFYQIGNKTIFTFKLRAFNRRVISLIILFCFVSSRSFHVEFSNSFYRFTTRANNKKTDRRQTRKQHALNMPHIVYTIRTTHDHFNDFF